MKPLQRIFFDHARISLLVLVIATGLFMPKAKTLASQGDDGQQILPGAMQMEKYLPLLEGKRVAVAGNHTSFVGEVHLVDTLLRSSVQVVKVFSPEHGFRGEAAAGELVGDSQDPQSGLPIISLYGDNRRPTAAQMKDVDIIVFDMQDVGTRFYTYISTMTYIMEEASALDIPMIILDRPNPNGHFIDGPILEPDYRSFVGLHPVPIVHGLTVGEYALMASGEGWLETEGRELRLTVIPVQNYHRGQSYHPPVPPSPNLPNMHAVYLYPSLCFFEGTVISVGRGTDMPFQIYGHPELPATDYPFTFTPESLKAAPNPPQEGMLCQGRDLRKHELQKLRNNGKINLQYLIEAYQDFPDQENFFNSFFDRLAGTGILRRQIQQGYHAEEIRKSWQEDLRTFQKQREPYLIYPRQ